MLYAFPVIFAIGGINFPVGVLIYWFTSNLWTMAQQFYVNRRNPAPGTPAYDAWEERRRAHGKLKTTPEEPEPGVNGANPSAGPAGNGSGAATPPRVGRQQPRKQTRSQRKV